MGVWLCQILRINGGVMRVLDGLLKNKYHDIILILSLTLAFFLLIIVSASSI